MAPPTKSLVPTAAELEVLSDEKVKVIILLADHEGRRSSAYSIFGMACGTLSFLGCLGAYVYLVTQNHETAAGVVLGTTVLAIIGRMIRGR